jgi:hypothetical protein
MESSALICIKLLKSGRLTPPQRSLATSRLLRHAKACYYNEFPDAKRWLREALRYKFDPWAWFLLMSLCLGISSKCISGLQRKAYGWMVAAKLKKQG